MGPVLPTYEPSGKPGAVQNCICGVTNMITPTLAVPPVGTIEPPGTGGGGGGLADVGGGMRSTAAVVMEVG